MSDDMSEHNCEIEATKDNETESWGARLMSIRWWCAGVIG